MQNKRGPKPKKGPVIREMLRRGVVPKVIAMEVPCNIITVYVEARKIREGRA